MDADIVVIAVDFGPLDPVVGASAQRLDGELRIFLGKFAAEVHDDFCRVFGLPFQPLSLRHLARVRDVVVLAQRHAGVETGRLLALALHLIDTDVSHRLLDQPVEVAVHLRRKRACGPKHGRRTPVVHDTADFVRQLIFLNLAPQLNRHARNARQALPACNLTHRLADLVVIPDQGVARGPPLPAGVGVVPAETRIGEPVQLPRLIDQRDVVQGENSAAWLLGADA